MPQRYKTKRDYDRFVDWLFGENSPPPEVYKPPEIFVNDFFKLVESQEHKFHEVEKIHQEYTRQDLKNLIG